jgi:hypothetical protein
MKLVQFWIGGMLVLLAVGLHFGYLNFDSVQNSNSTQVPTNSTSPVTSDNASSYNATWYNTTELFAGNFSTGRLMYTVFAAEPIWMIWTSVGLVACWLAIKDRRHHHYDWGGYHSGGYSPSPRPSPTITEPEEDLPEAVAVEKDTLTVMKCPGCGGNLKFGSSDVTDCPFCGAEVRRKPL